MELGAVLSGGGPLALELIRVGDTASDRHPNNGATWSSTGSESACAVRPLILPSYCRPPGTISPALCALSPGDCCPPPAAPPGLLSAPRSETCAVRLKP